MANMFKELKETMIKAVKEGMMTMPHPTENFSKEIEIIKKKKRTKQKFWS